MHDAKWCILMCFWVFLMIFYRASNLCWADSPCTCPPGRGEKASFCEAFRSAIHCLGGHGALGTQRCYWSDRSILRSRNGGFTPEMWHRYRNFMTELSDWGTMRLRFLDKAGGDGSATAGIWPMAKSDQMVSCRMWTTCKQAEAKLSSIKRASGISTRWCLPSGKLVSKP